MEAKDRLLTDEEIEKAIEESYGWGMVEITPTQEGTKQRETQEGRAIAKAQAEISFKAGKQVGFEIGIEQGEANGKREVVEILRKIGWDRAADDVELSVGKPYSKSVKND